MSFRFRAGVALAFVVAASGASAQVPGQGGSQPGDLDGGTPIADATGCQSCHDKNVSLDPTLYAPWDGWVTSMMANAARDPLYRAAVTVANQDVPGIGTFCLRCHSPQSYVRGHATPADGSAFDEIDLQGVSCEVCHRSVPSSDGGYLISNAQLFFEKGNAKHGPYENIVSPAHEGALSPFISSSALCGQCHQISNPLSDWKLPDGGASGRGFPLDTTYEEWLQSDFSRPGGKGCIDCHMQVHPGSHRVASLGPERTDPKRHVFVGANIWGVSMIEAANPDLAAEFGRQFDETRALARKMLEGAAELELVAAEDLCAPKAGQVEVTVRNLTGHKLPTGYADARRMWIELSVDGFVVSGAYDAVEAELVEDEQLRVYEARHGRFDVGPGDHLARHDTVFKDTRIPPAGFVATDATRPVATSWFDDGDAGFRDHDVARFRIEAPPRPYVVRARLLFQATTREHIEALREANVTDATGETLHALWLKTGRAEPVQMAVAELAGDCTPQGAPDAGPVEPPPEDPPRSCGCSAEGASLFGMLPLLVAALARRRRSVR